MLNGRRCLTPFTTGGKKLNAEVYFVRWMEDVQVHGAQASSAYSISQVVPHDVLQYLASDNNQVVPAMTAAIAGVETNTSENPIGCLVAPVITRVIEDDLKRSATNYGHLVIGAHLEMHLVDAMRRLVRGGKWIAKQSGFWRQSLARTGRRVRRLAGCRRRYSQSSCQRLIRRHSKGSRHARRSPGLRQSLAAYSAWCSLLDNRYSRRIEAKEGMVKLRDGAVIFPQGYDFEPFKSVTLTLSAPIPVAPIKSVESGSFGAATTYSGGEVRPMRSNSVRSKDTCRRTGGSSRRASSGEAVGITTGRAPDQ